MNVLKKFEPTAYAALRIVRSKTAREETRPLEPSVGNAIAHYLRHARPETPSRIVFLTVRAPYRPLSAKV